MRNMLRRVHAAFSLTEMIVVIGVAAVLALLLLPALVSADETARRSTCMNNLNQLAKATASYTGDYAGYFPISPGIGHMVTDRETRTLSSVYRFKYPAQRAGKREALNSGTISFEEADADFSTAVGVGQWMSSFYGVIAVADAEDADKTAGSLNGIPIGLGMLAYSGYMPDLRAYYCPSGRVMDQDAGTEAAPRYAVWRGKDEAERATLQCNAGDVARLGKLWGQTLVWGDWSWNTSRSVNGKQSGIACSYAYRNQPFIGNLRQGVEPGKHGYWFWEDTRKLWRIPGTEDVARAPQVQFDNGSLLMDPPHEWASDAHKNAERDAAAWYKWPYPNAARYSVKLLGGRAMVADRFGRPPHGVKPWLGEDYGYDYDVPGDGIFAHRDGYNVLFGGGDVRWMADPEEWWIWQPEREGIAQPYNGNNLNTLGAPGSHDWKFWDQAAGMDVKTPVIGYGARLRADSAGDRESPFILYPGK